MNRRITPAEDVLDAIITAMVFDGIADSIFLDCVKETYTPDEWLQAFELATPDQITQLERHGAIAENLFGGKDGPKILNDAKKICRHPDP